MTRVVPILTQHYVDLFMSKVDKTEDCWLWTGRLNRDGYGSFPHGPRGDVRRAMAHRFSYWLQVGEVPEGLTLDHLCKVRHCVNPAHLEPVTQAENARRGIFSPERIRAWRERPTCLWGHALAGENLYVYENRRGCRQCRREATQRYQARLALKAAS